MVETSNKRQRTLLSFIGRPEALPSKSNNWNNTETMLIYSGSHAISLEDPLRIAAFDLDETIITTASKRRFGRDENDWCFLLPEVSKKLKNLVHSGFTVVIFTNQLGIGLDKTGKRAEVFEKKVENVFAHVDIPLLLLASIADDIYRKPCPGMWDYFVANYVKGNNILLSESFFVGDAAGRPEGWKTGKLADHASADRKFAHNIGLSFYTPEQFFLGEAKVEHVPDDFVPSEIAKEICQTNVNGYCVRKDGDELEVIIFVGSPASGKSTFYRRHLQPHGYQRVSQDELRSRSKCLSRLDALLTSKASAVLDNTNPTVESRKVFIDTAKKHGARVRCFWFQSHPSLTRHLNSHRSIIKRVPRLPEVAFASFESKFEAPSPKEGFDEIVKIPFSPDFECEEDAKIFRYFLS